VPMQKISNVKRITFYFILILGIYIFSEIFSFTLYFVVRKEKFSFSKYQSYRLALIHPETFKLLPAGGVFKRPIAPLAVGFRVSEVIHPYLGFVRDPTKMPGHSEFGFPGEKSPITLRTQDNLIIGILGGSFAEGTVMYGKETLINLLKQSQEFQDKEIIVHTLAMAGYKQPQQLFTLAYFLMLGAQFDVIINIDGFNEVVLPQVENLPKHVTPYYPRSWFARTYNFSDADTLKMLGQIMFLAEKRKDWANLFVTSPLKYNLTCNLIWRYYDMKLYHKQVDKEVLLQQYKIAEDNDIGYMLTGPSFHYDNESDEMYKVLSEIWKNSSIQMHRLCQANRITYLHFLQPNQYVPGSKIMTQEELAIAFSTHEGSYKDEVEKGYPYLIQEGKVLKNDYSVNFQDLTMVFVNNDEVLYSDACCHLNEKGYTYIATIIGKMIIEQSRKNLTISLPFSHKS
jgi:hypothetical protein